jgi:hypothetical protein
MNKRVIGHSGLMEVEAVMQQMQLAARALKPTNNHQTGGLVVCTEVEGGVGGGMDEEVEEERCQGGVDCMDVFSERRAVVGLGTQFGRYRLAALMGLCESRLAVKYLKGERALLLVIASG